MCVRYVEENTSRTRGGQVATRVVGNALLIEKTSLKEKGEPMKGMKRKR
jgi:hypothetical protein